MSHTEASELRKATEQLADVLSAADLGFWTWDVPRDQLIGDPRIAFLFGIYPQIAQAARQLRPSSND
jgi:hypothetical protein